MNVNELLIIDPIYKRYAAALQSPRAWLQLPRVVRAVLGGLARLETKDDLTSAAYHLICYARQHGFELEDRRFEEMVDETGLADVDVGVIGWARCAAGHDNENCVVDAWADFGSRQLTYAPRYRPAEGFEAWFETRYTTYYVRRLEQALYEGEQTWTPRSAPPRSQYGKGICSRAEQPKRNRPTSG